MIKKSSLTPLRKGGGITVHRGKGASEQTLPSRHAMNTLTQGNPAARTFQDYAKASPMNLEDDSTDIYGG